MCLRCSPTLPLLKDHLLCFFPPVKMMGIFKTWSEFFFHWTSSDSLGCGLSGFFILTEMVSHQMPSPRNKARLPGHSADTVNVEHLLLSISKGPSAWLLLCLSQCAPTSARQIFGANAAESVQPQLPPQQEDRAAAFCFSFEEVGSPEAAALGTRVGLSLSCHHLGSHQGCDSLAVPDCRAFLLAFPPSFFRR